MIEKKSKNSIVWKGGGPGSNTQEFTDRVAVLKGEISELDKHEKMLDQHRQVREVVLAEDKVGKH